MSPLAAFVTSAGRSLLFRRLVIPLSQPRRPYTTRWAAMSASTPAAATTARNPDIARHLPGPNFSQVVVHDNIVYLSGQVAQENACEDRSAFAQTVHILGNIDTLLARAGTDKTRLLTGMIWVTDIADVAAVNKAWAAWVDPEHKPVRACVQAALVRPTITVEIQVTAALPPRPSKRLVTPLAAAAVGPYAQAVVTRDDTIFVSGCIGLTADTGEFAGDTVEAQTTQVLQNLAAILAEGGASAGDIVKTTVLLDNMDDFAAVNALYQKFFEGYDVPARACFAAKQLPKGALVEIEAIAVRPPAVRSE